MIVRDYIKIKKGYDIPNLELLLDKLFGRLLFVKDFDLALKYSAMFKLDCITGEGEIAYSGGFLSKMGFYDISKERISNYNSWKAKFLNQKTIKLGIEKLKKEKDQLANQDLRISQDL